MEYSVNVLPRGVAEDLNGCDNIGKIIQDDNDEKSTSQTSMVSVGNNS